jgi:hypothetical protein
MLTPELSKLRRTLVLERKDLSSNEIALLNELRSVDQLLEDLINTDRTGMIKERLSEVSAKTESILKATE